jgi:hypothetical protein
MTTRGAIEIAIGAAVIIRATENARKTGITITRPAAATIIALAVLHTDQRIEEGRPNGLETRAGAGNAAQTAMTRGMDHPQSLVSL